MCLLLFVAPFSWAEVDSIKVLNKKIQDSQGQWVAGRTSVSDLSWAEKRAMMDSSLLPHPEVQFEIPDEGIKAFATPISIDWRNKDGKSWLTPIRHQGSCGSCLAFAATATLEAQYKITQNKSYKLSPQFLFSCGGGVCKKGWYPNQAAKFLLNTGVTDESCLPYMSSGGSDISCSRACGDSSKRAVKISSFSLPTDNARNLSAIREALQRGPLVTTMAAYNDFMNYRGGIYKRVSNSLVGGHAIVIIGYNDKDRYLIIRNSWGTSWGERGYGRISYDDTSGIGATTWKYEVPKAKVFDLPILNASLDFQVEKEALSGRQPAGNLAEPDFMLTAPVPSKNATDSFELTLKNLSGFNGEITFHQRHEGIEKTIQLNSPATELKIRLNSNLLAAGDWEFYVSAKDSAGRVITSEKHVLTMEP
ncbi:hypothetical protein AZI86_01785 [Bdellovibrio bacteriovorus]|uniref:Peptidase C1A papain C-terminal domain-containing protein n=1 Tax=Bdellovibrio bacteriovorus TaxID=959 RepID=A0A150WN40_BDEBC|nr:hypothetical protein AZI86_01785 [Bdellovibrio bacteriovorus]